jgi:hypothetical protein
MAKVEILMSGSIELTRQSCRLQPFAAVVILLLCGCPAAWAEQGSANRYKSMASSMFDMMDAFSSEYQKRGGSGRLESRDRPITSHTPRGGGYTPWGMGSASPWNQGHLPGLPRGWWGAAPFGQHPPSTTAPLDGHWQGRNGEILSVDNGWFRIQQNRDGYREGRISLLEQGRLLMLNPDTGISRMYEYAEQQGRLVLRGDSGFLLFRRVD